MNTRPSHGVSRHQQASELEIPKDSTDIGKQVTVAGMTGEQLKAGPWTKAAAGLAAAGMTGILAKAGLAVAAAANPIGMAAAVAGTMAASYLGADLVSGVFHHAVDNYTTPGEGRFGEMASEFIGHHYFGNSLSQSEPVENVNPLVKVAGPALVGLALAPINPLLGVAAAVGIGGTLVAQLSHRFSHEPRPPKAIQIMQDTGITQSKKDHAKHHRVPWSTNYTIVNGALNPILDKTNFWRKWENVIFKVTGVEPKTWKHPAIKDFATGKISEKEYKERFQSEIPVYKERIGYQQEREQAKQYLHNKFVERSQGN